MKELPGYLRGRCAGTQRFVELRHLQADEVSELTDVWFL